MAQLNSYVNFCTYYKDLKVIDERLSNLEYNIDQITKNLVELLSNKTTNYREENK